jgi:glutamate synthase domain-containing protein 2
LACVRRSSTVLHRHATQVEGVGLPEIAAETVSVHQLAFGDDPGLRNHLDVGGEYAFRTRGEAMSGRPSVVADLQHAVRGNMPEKYREFARQVNEQDEQLMTLRGLFRMRRPRRWAAHRCRWTRSSPPSRSSSALPPAPCRSARSAARRTPRWRWP